MLLTLTEIKAEVDRLAKIINASQDVLPTYGFSAQDGRPHIDIGSQGYYYLILDRDAVCDSLITKDMDELLYKIFSFTTFELAIKYERTHRVQNQDSRKIMFLRQVELLSMLSSQWAERELREQEKLLEQTHEQHPIYDYSSIFATLTKHLREKGYFQKIASESTDKENVLPKDSKR